MKIFSACYTGTDLGATHCQLCHCRRCGERQGIYMNFCAPCHATGVAGAPKVGDKAAWAPRLKQGEKVLVERSSKATRGAAASCRHAAATAPLATARWLTPSLTWLPRANNRRTRCSTKAEHSACGERLSSLPIGLSAAPCFKRGQADKRSGSSSGPTCVRAIPLPSPPHFWLSKSPRSEGLPDGQMEHDVGSGIDGDVFGDGDVQGEGLGQADGAAKCELQ